MTKSDLPKALEQILHDLEDFEASESVAETGTGARREGEAFESLVAEMWKHFAALCKTNGANLKCVQDGFGTRFYMISKNQKVMLVPGGDTAHEENSPYDKTWTRLNFKAEELIGKYPGAAEAQERYAPTSGPFSGNNYSQIYTGSSTKFDGTLVMINNGVMTHKVLLEYKTAKSSRGARIDGNAHERLTFQVMQYLEIATLYTRCSMTVLSNGALVRYKNKYHTNFHVQADRLKCFSWFNMNHMSTRHEFADYLAELLKWLKND
jgi:hypothetical protein